MLRILNSLSYSKFTSTPIKSSIALGSHHSLLLTPDKTTGNPVLNALGSNGNLKHVIVDFGQCGFAEFAAAGFLEEEEDETLDDCTRMMNGLLFVLKGLHVVIFFLLR